MVFCFNCAYINMYKMKKMILSAAVCMLALSATAGDDKPKKSEHGDKYCAKMKDGKMTIMHEGKAISKHVTLEDGSGIDPDGTITAKDGSKTMLGEGECISKEGKV